MERGRAPRSERVVAEGKPDVRPKRAGKWTICCPIDQRDAKWSAIKENVRQKKVYAATAQHIAGKDGTIAICVEVLDMFDTDEVQAALDVIRSCGIQDKLFCEANEDYTLRRRGVRFWVAGKQAQFRQGKLAHETIDGEKAVTAPAPAASRTSTRPLPGMFGKRTRMKHSPIVAPRPPPPAKHSFAFLLDDGNDDEKEETLQPNRKISRMAGIESMISRRHAPHVSNETFPQFKHEHPSAADTVEILLVSTPTKHHAFEPNLRAIGSDPVDDELKTILIGSERKTLKEACTPRRPCDRLRPKQLYEQFVRISRKQCVEIEAAPQRSAEWLRHRKYRITASRYGAAAGRGSYKTAEEDIAAALWESFRGNACTRWGTEREPCALEAYEAWAKEDLRMRFVAAGKDPEKARLRVREYGLIVYPECPWMGASPDGIVEYTDPETGRMRKRLVEFKCPFYKFDFCGKHPYHGQGPGGCKPEYFD